MEAIESVLDKLRTVFGLDVKRGDPPTDSDGKVFCDESSDRTYFSVAQGGVRYFYIDGSDERAKVTAALAAEYVSTALCGQKKSADDPIRSFLSGGGELPSGVNKAEKSDLYVFAVYGAEKHKGVFEYLSAMAGSHDFVADMGNNTTAFCKRVDNDSDYQSAGEFALVLHENISEEIKGSVKIGVGGVAHGVYEMPVYYSYARSALVSGAEFDSNNDVYSYKEYALLGILSELSPKTREKYVQTVLDKQYRAVLSDVELMTAADSFIKHSLNISEAARHMYVHRNTLIYRLDKIEKITGLNIRNFNDAMSLRIAYLISKSL